MLYEHQKKLIEANPLKIGIFFECGGGKTLTAIRLVENNIKTCLIICPKSLKDNWQNELEKWSCNQEVNYFIYSKEEFKKHIKKIPRCDGLIWDEAHYASIYTSQIHKATLAYIKYHNPKCIYLLTGTPYMANSWSVYGLAKILDWPWTWLSWRRRFFNEVKMGRRVVPVQKKGIEGLIAKIVNEIGVTVKLKDLVDIPEQIFLQEYFELNKKQEEEIDNLNETVGIVEWTKKHEIENGILKSDGYTSNKIFKCEKTDRVIELCKEHKKIAIVARYNIQLKHYQDLLQSIKKSIYLINGETKDKITLIDQVNKDEECVVLIQGACSEGYNLWSVPIMVFASYDFSLKNYLQMLARIQRIDNIKKNVYISLITKKGVDRDVYDAVVNKKQDFHIEIYNKSKK